MDNWQYEINKKTRFEFGKNWLAYKSTINSLVINKAKKSLQDFLNKDDLSNLTFIDIGSGSGLFSLSAITLGANVLSIDYDNDSIACTSFLKNKYFKDNEKWKIEEASILDTHYVESIGKFDVVYSWGVLHHTGNLKLALDNTINLVKDGGLLAIAIYNDQGFFSSIWRLIKKVYCANAVGKYVIIFTIIPSYFIVGAFISDLWKLKNPFHRYLKLNKRGMSIYYDWFDWLGGLPFEVAKPDYIIEFFQKKGLVLVKKNLVGNKLGCNEFLFLRNVK